MIITGGAGTDESAAIAAVIAHLLEQEAAAAARPTKRPRQSDWIRAWRPQNVTAAARSHPGGPLSTRRVDPHS